MMKKLIACSVSVAALTMGMAGVAAAQTNSTSAQSAVELDDVVVTARRREERLQDVPISVIAASGEQLKARGVQTVGDLSMVAPGVSFEAANGRPSTLQVAVRGQRMYGIAPTQDPPTAMYFADALVQPLVGFNMALHDIANVQVLKGPQGTLFGRNTTGGAVTITPNRPTDQLAAELTSTLGNYGTYGVKGFVNLPVNDQLQLRLAAYHQHHDGYQHVVTPGHTDIEAGDDTAKDVRVSVVYKPTDNITNYLVGYWGKDNNGMNIPRAYAINPTTNAARFGPTGAAGFNQFPSLYTELYRPGDDFTAAYTRFRQFENVKVQGLVENFQIELGGITLKNIIGYRNAKSTAFFDVGGVDVPYIDSPNANDTSMYTEEFQLQGNLFDNRLNWTGGLYAVKIDSDDFSTGSTYNVLNNPTILTPTVTHYVNKTAAAYMQGTFKATDKLSLTAGVRYTKDTRIVRWMHHFRLDPNLVALGIPNTAPFCNQFNDAGVRLPITACYTPVKKSFTEPTWNLSADYHVTPNTLLYVTQRRGYRTGGYNFRGSSLATRIPFDPETVMDYEVGVKNDFYIGDMGVRLNADVYYDKYKNLQRTVAQILAINGQVGTSIFNAAAGNTTGFEGEVTVKPTPELTLSANYSYIHFKYTSFPIIAGGSLRDFSDRKLAGVPTHQVSAYANYTAPLPNDQGEVSLTANFQYFGSTFISEIYQSNAQIAVLYTPAQQALFAADIPYKTRAYKLVNLEAAWRNVMGRPVDLSFYARNVFNTAAMTFTSPQFEGGGMASVGFAPPRTTGVQLTYHFGE